MAPPNPGPLIVQLPFPQEQPLPGHSYDQNDSRIYEAYEQCLLREAEANSENDPMGLMYARCLGYLISEAPDDNSRNTIANEILGCEADSTRMDALAKLYIDHVVRLFRQIKGHTPAPSDHLSRPSFEDHRAFFSAAVESAPRDHRTAKHSALIRDNYCCLITGVADIKQYGEMTMAERQAFGLVGRDLRNTNFCHILPPSTNWNLRPVEHGHAKTLYSESVSTLIGHYGNIDGLAELDGPQGHRLSNGLTLSVDSHALFDDLALWFEEIPGQPNTYTVKTLFPTSLNRVVTFGTTTDLELPDPRYLRLHATICRVAHMSGAARYVDLLIEEMETTNVLANDGSSGDLLRDQLQNLQLRQRQPGA